MAKPNYYQVDEILKCNAQYLIVYGGRSNGKSYAVKHYCCKQAFDDSKKKFIYLRRRDMESATASVLSYFNDVDLKKCFGKNAKEIVVKSKRIYVVMTDPDNEKKVIDRIHIGYVCNLAGYSHTCGENYDDVANVIFEEFISRESYLKDEPNTLVDFVSTVARLRNIRVWLLGNTITRFCPYFNEWELKGINKQEPNTIDLYRIRSGRTDSNGNEIIVHIAVERTPEISNDSKMFFGKRAKMIAKGEWQADEKPHLPRRIETYISMYQFVAKALNFMFWCQFLYDPETNGCFWYIEPKTTPIKENTRVCSDTFNPSPWYTTGLIPLTPEENDLFKELLNEKVVYSDNLTGTEFKQALEILN